MNNGPDADAGSRRAGSRRGRLRLLMGALIASGLLLVGLVLLAILGNPPLSLQVINAIPEVRFIGVRPGAGRDIFDAQGMKIAEMDLPARKLVGEGPMGNRDLIFTGPTARDFILEVAASGEPIVFLPTAHISVQGYWLGYGPFECSTCTIDGRTILMVHAYVMSSFYKNKLNAFLHRKTEVDLVTLWVRYYKGPRPGVKAPLEFTGPFALGKATQSDTDQGSTFTPGPSAGGVTRLVLTNARRSYVIRPCLVYDTAGKRYLARHVKVEGAGGSIGVTFEVEGVPVDGIAAITTGENPQKLGFANIRIAYPDRAGK